MTDSDPFDTEEWRNYAQHALDEMVPKLDSSAFAVALVPRKPETATDIKFCMELGAMVMLDKPIIAVIQPGSKVPGKLAMIADEIIEMPEGVDHAVMMGRISEAIKRIVKVRPDET